MINIIIEQYDMNTIKEQYDEYNYRAYEYNYRAI